MWTQVSVKERMGRVPHPCALFAQEPALSLPKGWDSTDLNLWDCRVKSV